MEDRMSADNRPLSSEEAKLEADEIAATAQRAGVEFDSKEAVEWMVAVSAAERESALAQDPLSGVFGHRISLLDFDQERLDYFRRLAQRVRTTRRSNVESALAIAGSSAQGKVQLFPGDNDFFERVNIKAATIDAARRLLRDIVRETAIRAFQEPDIVLLEVNLGVYAEAVIERGQRREAGQPITWQPADLANGYCVVARADKPRESITLKWDEVQAGSGWTYFGWIVADRSSGQIALASNMLDVTWEAPDGTLTSLDGSIDPFFQEIYLDAAALPVFTKIVKQVDPNALNAYIEAMRNQVVHYTQQEPNFGKASKRLYNLFRLTDQLEAAAYVRELFDEPGACLYQVPGLLDAIDAARDESAGIDRTTISRQIDRVIQTIEAAQIGSDADKMIIELTRLRGEVDRRSAVAQDWAALLTDVRSRCSAIVNEFFRVRLLDFPPIQKFVAALKETGS
jgi:hypothetical protein